MKTQQKVKLLLQADPQFKTFRFMRPPKIDAVTLLWHNGHSTKSEVALLPGRLQSLVMMFALASTTSGHDTKLTCPDFRASYAKCEKTDGILPPFFSSVEIRKKGSTYIFVTETVQGPQTTRYTPDRVVRLGRDHHFTAKGETLENLTSHESSYCEEGVLHISEITFLPNGTIAQEKARMEIDTGKRLLFSVVVDTKTLLRARCE